MSYFRPQKIRKTGPRSICSLPDSTQKLSRKGGRVSDKTGQSLHVDEYAGPRASETRKLMAQNLDRILRRMKNANATHSRDKWTELLSQ